MRVSLPRLLVTCHMENLILSFDFDGSLDSNLMLKNLCKSFIQAGAKVFILTNRFPDEGAEVLNMAHELGLSQSHVLYARGTTKAAMIKKHAIACHFDDDEVEVHQINYECGPIACLINYQMRTGDGLI